MIIVLDTHVVVAGLLTPHGPCGDILRWVADGAVTLALDARITTEYREGLHRPKFKLDAAQVDALLDHIEHQGRWVATQPLPAHLSDRDDEAFLEVALAGQAAALVTGNGAHFPAPLRHGCVVLSPRAFVDRYRHP